METNLMQMVFLIIACGLAFQAYRNNQNSKKAKKNIVNIWSKEI